MKKFYFFLLFVSFILIFASCSGDNINEPQSLNSDVTSLNKGGQGQSGESNVYHYDLKPTQYNINNNRYVDAWGKITFQILADGYCSYELNGKNLEPGATYYLYCSGFVSTGDANSGGNLHLAGKFLPNQTKKFVNGFNLRNAPNPNDGTNIALQTGGNLDVSYP